MAPLTHSISTPSISSMFLTTIQFPSPQPKTISSSTSSPASLTLTKSIHFGSSKKNPCPRSSFQAPRCSVSVAEIAPKESLLTKPSPAEVSRTIMELSSVGTLSTLAQDGWPLAIGVRFVVDERGMPVLCLNASNRGFSLDRRFSLHVQLEQCGTRTPQCTLQGNLNKPGDGSTLKRLCALWMRQFGEEVDEDLLYVVAVEQVLQMEDFREDGIWVTSSDYVNANPDPLRYCAEDLVNEINSRYMEDVHRFCSVYIDSGFKVEDAKMIWVDRLGFDVHFCSGSGVYQARIPFPREVIDKKGAKSAFNCMSQLAWEVDKNLTAQEFEKVKDLKIRHGRK